jgi:uncharacterized protein YjbI with pentapeptide repeats
MDFEQAIFQDGLALNGANLTGANFRCALLKGADLTGAVIENADFRGAFGTPHAFGVDDIARRLCLAANPVPSRVLSLEGV